MIFLIATLRIRPDSFASVMEAVKPCLAATRLEAGCLSYDLTVNVADPEELVFIERWESQAALDAHFETPHLKAWRTAGGPYMLSRKIEIIHPERVDML